ncbi:hypothetical protein GGG16DRAFT_52814 [Schizophyllum commune]
MPSKYTMLDATGEVYQLERRDLYHPLAALDVADMQGLIMQIGVDFALYGMQSALSIAAVAVLARREGPSRFMMGVILVLLVSSLLGVISNALFYLVQLPYELGTSVQDVMGLLVRLDIMGTVANNFNYLVSDAVVVWRAYILWSDSLVAKGILLSFLTGTLGNTLAQLIYLYMPSSPLVDYHIAIQSDVKLAFLLATNVVATVLIGIKFWYYRRDIKGALGLFTRKSQVEKVLVLLLESGITYCAIWIAYTIIWTDAEGLNISYYTSDTFGSSIHNIAGIYPTFVVLVAMQSNAAQELLGTQVSQAMRFADLPMMSVASESGSQEASAMHDPSLRLGQTIEQSSYTSTDDSRAEAVGSANHDSLGDARKSNEKDNGIAIITDFVRLDRYRLSSAIMMSGLNLTPAEGMYSSALGLAVVMGLVPGPVPVPAEMTDEHRKILLASQLRVIATLSPAAQGVLHCRFAAEYLPRAVEKWRNSEDVLCPPVMLLSEIDWCPYVLRFLLLKDNQDLVVTQFNRTLQAADAIDGMEMEELDRVMHVLCTLLLVQGRLGISEADAEAFTPRLRAWERRYPDDLNRNTAERCFVLLTRPFATRIYYIPDLRAEKMKGVETCANSKCYQSVTVDEKPLLRCKKCKSAMYCCREHQKAHWPAHKSRCFEVNY